MNRGVLKYFGISLVVIIIDQIVKMVVHFNMVKGPSGEIRVFGDWFKLHYLTNPGMAFGMELPFENAKIVLTIFRLGAMFAIGYYLYFMYKKGAPQVVRCNRQALLCRCSEPFARLIRAL